MIEQRLPFMIRSYDNDNGSEFINTDFITHLQQLDIQQTRSRPYRKNDQATVESRNNHVVRKHAFYYRYELAELDLLNELWQLVSVKVNLFTPSKKPVGRSSTRDGRPRRVYDQPTTPWERLKRFDEQDRADGGTGCILPERRDQIERLIAETNPAELVRRIHAIQDQLEDMAAPRTRRSRNASAPTWHTWTGHSPRSRASDRKTTTKHQPTPTRISRSLPVRHHSRFRAHFQMRHLGRVEGQATRTERPTMAT